MTYITHFLRRILDRFATKLPTSNDELEAYMTSILADYQLPDGPSYKEAIATAIMHVDQSIDRVPRYRFVAIVRKAMANQCAYEAVLKMKAQSKAYHERIAAEEQAAITASAVVAKAQD